MAKSQLSQTHSWFQIASLGIQISHGFKLLLDIVIVTIHLFIEYTERKPIPITINTISWVFVDYFLMRLIICS